MASQRSQVGEIDDCDHLGRSALAKVLGRARERRTVDLPPAKVWVRYRPCTSRRHPAAVSAQRRNCAPARLSRRRTRHNWPAGRRGRRRSRNRGPIAVSRRSAPPTHDEDRPRPRTRRRNSENGIPIQAPAAAAEEATPIPDAAPGRVRSLSAAAQHDMPIRQMLGHCDSVAGAD